MPFTQKIRENSDGRFVFKGKALAGETGDDCTFLSFNENKMIKVSF